MAPLDPPVSRSLLKIITALPSCFFEFSYNENGANYVDVHRADKSHVTTCEQRAAAGATGRKKVEHGSTFLSMLPATASSRRQLQESVSIKEKLPAVSAIWKPGLISGGLDDADPGGGGYMTCGWTGVCRPVFKKVPSSNYRKLPSYPLL